MPRFRKMAADRVHVGKGRASAAEREFQMYVSALMGSEAGKITLQEGDVPSRVKRMLADAARSEGVKIRSRWEDDTESVLLWKKVGA